MKFFSLSSRRERLITGFLTALTLIFSYFFFFNGIRFHNYQIFDTRRTISWVDSSYGIYRKDARGDIDNIFLSNDRWKQFTLQSDLIHPRNGGLLFHYADPQNFDFVFFNREGHSLIWGTNGNGESKVLSGASVDFSDTQMIELVVDGKGEAEFFFNGNKVSEQSFERSAGRFGLMLSEALQPSTVFHGLSVRGTLEGGRAVSAQSPSRTDLGIGAFLGSWMPFYILFLLGCFYLIALFYRSVEAGETADSKTPSFWIAAIHLALTAVIFLPFLLEGKVLVSSYDNFGEIYPLFFYSRRSFLDLMAGHGAALWMPYFHDGMPFYSNHWNMIYYPLNWPIFLAPERMVLKLLTFKTFVEVFFTGICAYGFLKREIGDERWALFSSICYQLCSLLIFTFTIFPSTALYFSMTLYLYILWSMPERRKKLNYGYMAIAVYLIMTSANVAFIFYASLALLVITVYRLRTLQDDRNSAIKTVIFAGLTGFFMSAVRILACLEGIAHSNRIVDNYYTLHDRAFAVIRLFLPEIAGWFGPGKFNAFTSPNLQLYFEHMDLPSNSQNAFFVYFGILPAMLLLVSAVIPSEGKLRFWKFYSGAALAIALLFQPFWGILSVLVFPLIHYSYHTIIIPAGVCVLVGLTGLRLEREPLNFDNFGGRFLGLFLLFEIYIFVFLTYLFPQITPTTRCLILLTGAGVWLFYRYRNNERISARLKTGFLAALNILIAVFAFSAAVLAILKPVPDKETAMAQFIIPSLLAFLGVTAALYGRYVCLRLPGMRLTKTSLFWAIVLAVPLVTVGFVASPVFQFVLAMQDGYRTYLVDMIAGQIKLLLMLQAGVLVYLLVKNKGFSRRYGVGLLTILLAADLLAFNVRFDNVIAPFSYPRAFYQNPFPYADIKPHVREKLNLTDYRVSALNKGGLNSNKALLFSVPSYTGIMGYMPQRFSKLIRSFGYPERTILIYPKDSTDNERFFDLSSVKYVFQDDETFTERNGVPARLNLLRDYDVIPDETVLLSRLKNPSFNPRTTVLLSKVPPEWMIKEGGTPLTPVPIGEAGVNRIAVGVQVARPAILLFNESFSPGWRAYANGERLKIVPANYNFMAVFLPPGEYKVEFRYEPFVYFLLRGISIVSGVVFVLGLIIQREKNFADRFQGGSPWKNRTEVC